MKNEFFLKQFKNLINKKKLFFERFFSSSKDINISNLKEKDSLLSTIVINSRGKDVKIEKTEDWFINISKLCQHFNRRWRDWKKINQGVIETFQSLEGKPIIRETGRKNQKQTYLNIKLALRVLSDYDQTFSWKVFSVFLETLSKDKDKILQELNDAYRKLELSKAEIAKLKNTAFKVSLDSGRCLFYAYLCNNIVKWGTSFKNIDGQRPKAHKTSVPDLEIGFIIYTSKEHLQHLNRAIKVHYNIKSKNEHLKNCTIKEFEVFVLNYMDLMKFEYQREDIHKLKLLSIWFKST